MTTNFKDFVKNTADQMRHYDKDDPECIMKLVREAIAFYEMKSREEIEDTRLGKSRFLYIYSMAEENLLTKIVEISKGSSDFDIEHVYEGRVIREY
ncbi:MAG: DUF6407 family protein [Bacillota bacterium]